MLPTLNPDKDFGGGMKLPEGNSLWFPDICPPADAALKGDRTHLLQHRMHRGVPLHHATKELVAAHIERFRSHNVMLGEAAD